MDLALNNLQSIICLKTNQPTNQPISSIQHFFLNVIMMGCCPHHIVANVQDCDVELSEFELQSRKYVHFPTNTLGKCAKRIPPAMGSIVPLLSFYKGSFDFK